MLGEDEDWLSDIAVEMDQEDGLIWVYGPGEDNDGVMASPTSVSSPSKTADMLCFVSGHARPRAGTPGRKLF
ncbi:MAG: hypothetical protein JWO72_2794 [Caulobacteraceae bacterium]|nr:hypothetical protein [Caulobacteraceae bacterium]